MIDDLVEKESIKYRRDFAVLEARRRQGMTLLAKGFAQAEVARAVGVSRMTVMRWARLRTTKPRAAWKRRRLVRPPVKKIGAVQ
jgi:transposase